MTQKITLRVSMRGTQQNKKETEAWQKPTGRSRGGGCTNVAAAARQSRVMRYRFFPGRTRIDDQRFYKPILSSALAWRMLEASVLGRSRRVGWPIWSEEMRSEERGMSIIIDPMAKPPGARNNLVLQTERPKHVPNSPLYASTTRLVPQYTTHQPAACYLNDVERIL